MKTKVYTIYKIYKLINLINGMPYIGYTSEKLIKRIRRHTIANSYIGNALRDYEIKNFKVKVLHEVADKNLALLLEIMEIWNNNSIRPNGYNLTPGGEGAEIGNQFGKGHVFKPSKETIKKMSEAKLGKKRPDQSKFMQGKKYAEGHKHSEEFKESIKGDKNPSHRIDVKIKKLKTRLVKLEEEMATIS